MLRTNIWSQLIRRAASSRQPTANRKPTRGGPSVRPRLERLEERTVPSILTVTSPTDSGTGSLRAVIAEAVDGDQIVFNSRLAGQTITLTSGELALTKSLDIEGLGADLLAVSGNHASRVFDISGGVTVAIAGLTITDGLAAGGPGTGGGIENTGSHLTVAGDTFSNNEASGTTGNGNGRGGAIDDTAGATLMVTHCLFQHNQASGRNQAFAGAIYTGNTTGTVTDSTFTSNQAIGGSGGGDGGGFTRGGAIYNIQGFLTVVNSTFTDNQAIAGSNNTGGGVTMGLGFGGAIANTDSANLIITGSTFRANHAVGGSHNTSTADISYPGDGHGGALLNVGVATVTDSLFEDNEAHGGDGNQGNGTGFQHVGSASGGAILTAPDNTTGLPGSLTLRHVTLRRNRAIGGDGNTAGTFTGIGEGGGLTAAGERSFGPSAGITVTVSDCTFADNQAIGGQGADGGHLGDARGGGLVNKFGAALTVSGTTFTRNQATGAAGLGADGGNGLGGGLYNDGPSTFPTNLGTPTSLTLLSSSIHRNAARGGAGDSGGSSAGLGAGGGILSAGILAILNSDIARNVAFGGDGHDGVTGGGGFGGGLAVTGGTASVLDTVIRHNQAVGGDGTDGGNGFGGGVYVSDGTVTVSASAITHNRACGGHGDTGTDGLGVGGVYNLGTVLFDAETVIAHNHASDSNDDCFGC